MPSGSFTAPVTSTANGPLTISQFYTEPPSTPGNVGICLSGGGSRALTAGMGQLRGLSFLQTSNGQSLLSQAKALSTVSGGSWLGVPYEFLPPSAANDASYLGAYNPNQGNVTLDQLAQLPNGNAGVPLNSYLFSPVGFAVEAYLLWEFLNVPANMLWQTVIALNILSNYNLYSPLSASNPAPNDTFSYDTTTVQNDVTNPNTRPPLNPTLAQETIYLFADQQSGSRATRPFLICNMAMLVNEPDTNIQFLAPVQASAFLTGILGTPAGTDANGQPLGGGAVTSFAFNSNFVSVQSGVATVNQTRQWSITDIVGTSSAFFAQLLQDQFKEWQDNPWEFLKTLAEFAAEIWQWIKNHLPSPAQEEAADWVREMASVSERKAALPQISWPDLQAIIPQYFYWPVSNPQPVNNPQPTMFADGGSLENTGICGLLAYSDIQSVISFLNSSVPLATGQYGISDGHGGYLPDTNFIVDEMIPPLFGYRPYEAGDINDSYTGYVLYANTNYTDYQMYEHNQVFDSQYFPAFLQGLAAAAGNGLNSNNAIFTQELPVMPNKWFGIAGREKPITVVWCYLNYVAAWGSLFANNPDVLALIQSEISDNYFPNYSTIDTDLSATQTNLMAGLTSWSVVSADQANATFSSLFNSGAAAQAGRP